MKIAIIFNQNKLSGRLTQFWTGCYAYHIGLLHEESDTFYDMHFVPRKTSWEAHKYDSFLLFDCELTQEDCEQYLKADSLKMRYGLKDYCLFAVRGLYHVFGKSTPNSNGWICSELVNAWLCRKGIITKWLVEDAPPSPCDFYRWLKD